MEPAVSAHSSMTFSSDEVAWDMNNKPYSAVGVRIVLFAAKISRRYG
jgi:hypothetical protein